MRKTSISTVDTLALFIATCCACAHLRGEGSEQLGTLVVSSETVLFADIVDASTEVLTWNGSFWSAIPPLVPETLRGVAYATGQTAVAVGDAGLLKPRGVLSALAGKEVLALGQQRHSHKRSVSLRRSTR